MTHSDVVVGQWTTIDDTSTMAAAGAGVGRYGTPGHTTAATVAGVVGRVWVYDPETGVLLGQVDYTPTATGGLEARFYAVVTDLAGAPRELVDPDTGDVVGRAIQSVFGRRRWEGAVSSPLLFTGQYEDTESGWVYNRNRFYDPVSGVYGAQDPLGVAANLGTAQGYVTNPLTWVDPLGLKAHAKSIKSTIDQPFRGGSYRELDTVKHDGTGLQRHHLVSQKTLRENQDVLTRADGT